LAALVDAGEHNHDASVSTEQRSDASYSRGPITRRNRPRYQFARYNVLDAFRRAKWRATWGCRRGASVGLPSGVSSRIRARLIGPAACGGHYLCRAPKVHGAKDRIGPIGHREVAGPLNPPIRLHISSETRGANVATEISAELFKSEQHQLVNCLYNAARMAG